jgi:hypothetical protein
MGTDDNGYELAVLSPARQRGKTPYRHPFFNRFTPSVGDTYASILGIPMRIPMLDGASLFPHYQVIGIAAEFVLMAPKVAM